MSERGFSMLEALLATAALSIVLLGVGVFYLSSLRMERDNDAQIQIQRQAAIIISEMRKQIGESTGSTLFRPCPGAVLDSIQATNSRGTYCFRRNDAGTGLLEDRPGGGQWDLLSGALSTLSTTTGDCPAEGGFCPTLLVKNGGPTVGAVITLRLRFQLPAASAYQTMTFTSTIAARN
jgi:type II secretory pathway pseudopilin PulG